MSHPPFNWFETDYRAYPHDRREGVLFSVRSSPGTLISCPFETGFTQPSNPPDDLNFGDEGYESYVLEDPLRRFAM